MATGTGHGEPNVVEESQTNRTGYSRFDLLEGLALETKLRRLLRVRVLETREVLPQLVEFCTEILRLKLVRLAPGLGDRVLQPARLGGSLRARRFELATHNLLDAPGNIRVVVTEVAAADLGDYETHEKARARVVKDAIELPVHGMARRQNKDATAVAVVNAGLGGPIRNNLEERCAGRNDEVDARVPSELEVMTRIRHLHPRILVQFPRLAWNVRLDVIFIFQDARIRRGQLRLWGCSRTSSATGWSHLVGTGELRRSSKVVRGGTLAVHRCGLWCVIVRDAVHIARFWWSFESYTHTRLLYARHARWHVSANLCKFSLLNSLT